MNLTRRPVAAIAAVVTATAGLLAGSGILAGAANAATPFIGPLSTVTVVASTTPANGDQNPYGVAVVPESTGNLHEGNVLVSNFNDITNTQGTGTTIVQVTPHGAVSVFAQIDRNLAGCPGGVGLTTALVALRSGWVIVGSLPTQTLNNTTVISGSGCLIVLDSHGAVRETFSGHGINGPWDMTALDLGFVSELFVTNVLNGTVAGGGAVVNKGTVLRLIITSGPVARPRLLAVTQIGSGFAERTDPSALVIGPTGVGLGRDGTLYVADSVNSRIAAIPHAIFRFSDDGAGRTVTQGGFLMGELGLAIAPNGDILTVNAGDGNMVETSPGGTQLIFKTVDSQFTPPSPPAVPGAGNLFGLAVKPGADAVYFVDDFGGPSATNNTNSLDLLSAP
jgi:hypothetical protein